TATAAVLTAALASACSAEGTPDLDQLREQVSRGVEDARGELDRLGDLADDAAELGHATRGQVDQALGSASAAVDQARAAVQDATDTAGPMAQDAREQASAALQRAREQVDAAAADARGGLRDGLRDLAAELQRLAERLDAG